MAVPRFYLPALRDGASTLTGPEAHHLLHVRRLKPGDEIELFDGLGHSATATITETGRKEVSLEVGAIHSDEPGASLLSLAVAFPKPDRARWMVEKLTELGVTSLIPLLTERSASSGKPLRVDKLQQYVIDACKQCGRNRLLVIEPPIPLADFTANSSGQLQLADPRGSRPATITEPTTVLIGPEGGFTEAERASALEAGATSVTFGQHVLRVETAAIAAACLLQTNHRN